MQSKLEPQSIIHLTNTLKELLFACRKIESQATQILSFEAARPELPADALGTEKDNHIAEQTKTIRELEIVVRGYEENLGELLRAVKENAEAEWRRRLEEEQKSREEAAAWADQLVRRLEEEKLIRLRLEEERRALAGFVSHFDSLGLASAPAIPNRLRKPTLPFSSGVYASRRRPSFGLTTISENGSARTSLSSQQIPESPEKPPLVRSVHDAPNLLDTDVSDFSELAELDPLNDMSFERGLMADDGLKESAGDTMLLELDQMKRLGSPRLALHDKENLLP